MKEIDEERDSVIKKSFDDMFGEHSGESSPELDDGEDLPDSMHVVGYVSVGELVGGNSRPYEND